jgi:SAM-dependent methyltransferase
MGCSDVTHFAASRMRDALRLRFRASVDLEWRTLRDAMTKAAPYAHGRLLDVGCGDKPWEQTFAPHVTGHVGLERTGVRQSRADVFYDGGRMPFADTEFDTVLSNQVLEHVADPRVVWADMVRVLRPGGTLVVTVPFSFRLHAEPDDYWRFTSHALRRLCDESRLRIEVLEPRGGLWLVIGHKLATFLAFDVGRLRGEAQAAGSTTYEPPVVERPRWWVVPPLVIVTAVARWLDRVDSRPKDSLGWFVVASK